MLVIHFLHLEMIIAGVPPANDAPFTDNKGSRVSIGTKISF